MKERHVKIAKYVKTNNLVLVLYNITQINAIYINKQIRYGITEVANINFTDIMPVSLGKNIFL